jgi:hypothetical protein
MTIVGNRQQTDIGHCEMPGGVVGKGCVKRGLKHSNLFAGAFRSFALEGMKADTAGEESPAECAGISGFMGYGRLCSLNCETITSQVCTFETSHMHESFCSQWNCPTAAVSQSQCFSIVLVGELECPKYLSVSLVKLGGCRHLCPSSFT